MADRAAHCKWKSNKHLTVFLAYTPEERVGEFQPLKSQRGEREVESQEEERERGEAATSHCPKSHWHTNNVCMGQTPRKPDKNKRTEPKFELASKGQSLQVKSNNVYCL